jgi:hypothetical protein
MDEAEGRVGHWARQHYGPKFSHNAGSSTYCVRGSVRLPHVTSEGALEVSRKNPVNQLPDRLLIDGSYRNTGNPNSTTDQFYRFFTFAGKSLNNTSGFKPKSRANGSTSIVNCAFCVIVTNLGEPEWPDSLDPRTGILTYYGDNRKPGTSVDETNIKGNVLLKHVFERLHQDDRKAICPFLYFESFDGAGGKYMRFKGIAVPGAQGLKVDDLTGVWRRTGKERFLNYKAIFTILKDETVPREWLDQLVQGVPALKAHGCPPNYAKWIKTGKYEPLVTEETPKPRSAKDQEPKLGLETEIVEKLRSLTAREFEHAVRDLLELMGYIEPQVTPAVRDNGRDVIAQFRVGYGDHSLILDVSCEAKRWGKGNTIGVAEVARLVSRLRHKDFGVFITTSTFNNQAQKELIADGHHVILIAGGDIAKILIEHQIVEDALDRWLEEIRSIGASTDTMRQPPEAD